MTQHSAAEHVFVGNSEMAQLMRSLDWSQTPLGEPSDWSQSLRTVLSILLTSQHPIFLWWGRELIQFYNDAYRPILGTTKHPQAMGQHGRECWQEIWPVIEPMIEAVMQRGEATRIQDGLLILERNGYLEECYFNYAYSPVRDETGEVGGVFCACDETTKRVLGERQLKTLRELAAQSLETKTVEESCQFCMGAIAKNPADLPFALLYLMDETGSSARLMGTAGIEPGTTASPEQIQIAEQGWSLGQVKLTGQPEMLTDLAARFDSLPNSLWNVPPQSAIVMPLNQSGQQQIAGFLILAISPRQAFDEEYGGFFDLVANQVETAIANARAHEEERKQAEALAELDRAKTAFFNNVSHEFRTPLTLMLSPLEDTLTSLEGTIPPQEREQLQLAQRNGKRLLKLVNSLLDFSRIEAGRVQVCYEPIDLSTFTAELASAFHSLIKQAGLSLVVECPPLPEAIYVDRDMWEKIVLNLVSNAFKFTLSGAITVRLQWLGSQVELSVTDTGVGIPPEELPHLFERFHRVENSQGRSFEGSGIGLSLVQELVKLQGGTIQVTSTLGQGSCFTVSIPTKVASLSTDQLGNRTLAPTTLDAMPYVEEARRWLPEQNPERPTIDFGVEASLALGTPNPVHQTDQTDPSDSQRSKFKVLLVDDNVDMRHYIQRLLSSSYTVQATTDGAAALEAIQSSRPDLVLTDVMMPRMDGFELLRSLRSDAATQDIPIILLSARAGEESRIEGLEAGADDYLTKPFSARELTARVEATLKLAQLRRTARNREQELQIETQDARAKLDQIVSNLRDGFITFDRNWRYTYINNRLLEILQLSPKAVIGKYAWDVMPHQVGIEFYDQLNRAMYEQVEVQFEFYYEMVDSWVEHRVYPTAEGVAILMADVSDRKRTEFLLAEQKRLLELTAAGVPMDDCLTALCTSVANLSSGVQACILLTDAQQQTFSSAITPRPLLSFGQGLQGAPINELTIGTCGTAVSSGQSVTCPALTCSDIINDDRWSQQWRDLCLTHGVMAYHSTLILGMDDVPLGALMLCFDEAREPSEWEGQLANFGTRIASIVFERDSANLALRNSEANYRTLFESIDEGFCIIKIIFDAQERPVDYRFMQVNPAFVRLTGLPEDALGKTARELIPDLEAFWIEAYGKVALTGESVRFENRAESMNRWFDVYASRVGDATNRSVAVVFNNITERKQAEEVVRRAAEMDAFRVSLADALRPLGTPLEVQATASRILGEYLGANRVVYFEIHGNNYVVEYDYVNGVEPLSKGSYSIDSFSVEVITECRAGRVVSVPNVELNSNLSPTQRSAYAAIQVVAHLDIPLIKDGEFVAGLAVHMSKPRTWTPDEVALAEEVAERTWAALERTRAEEALRESEERLRVSQLSAKIGTWDWNVAAGSVIWSPEYYALFGLDPALPSTYENWLETLVDADRAPADQTIRDALQQQQTYLDFEFRSCHPNQGIRWFSCRGQIFYDSDGQPQRAIGIAIDINERKQAEATLAERASELTRLNGLLAESATLLEERNLELDRFVHIVSHDLKAPLRGIANLSQWIEEDLAEALSEDTQGQMSLLRDRVHRMEAMIDGLLDYARAGRTDTMIATVDVEELIAEVIDSIAPPPTFQIVIAPGMPTLRTKRLLLSQVFSNLISNGVKHHPRPDGSIRISSQDLGDFYEFKVADDGSGIAPEYHDKIFMIFQTVNPQKNADSSGVGLSIVKKIVETEEGTIRLESQVGEGTTFYFTWPKTP
jgi:PAS domain S-box-containing protein